MQCAEGHSSSRISGVALHRHIRHDIGAVLDVGGLTERGICTGYVVMIPTHHDRAAFALPNQLVKGQRDVPAAFRILIKYASLGSDHQLVFLGITDPYPVVSVLRPAVRVDGVHRRLVRRSQILRFSGEADPAEGAVAVIKQHRAHDVFYIGRPDEPVFVVHAVLRHFLNAGIIHSLHEGIAVIKEVAPSLRQGANRLEMPAQGFVHLPAEFLSVAVQELCALLEAHARRAVAAVIHVMAGGLIRQKIDLEILLDRGLQQVHDISMVCDGDSLLRRLLLIGQPENFVNVVHDHVHPSLVVPCLNAGVIHLGEDSHSVGDVCGLRLRTAHSAQS